MMVVVVTRMVVMIMVCVDVPVAAAASLMMELLLGGPLAVREAAALEMALEAEDMLGDCLMEAKKGE
jgi:hypothetical protein